MGYEPQLIQAHHLNPPGFLQNRVVCVGRFSPPPNNSKGFYAGVSASRHADRCCSSAKRIQLSTLAR